MSLSLLPGASSHSFYATLETISIAQENAKPERRGSQKGREATSLLGPVTPWPESKAKTPYALHRMEIPLSVSMDECFPVM